MTKLLPTKKHISLAVSGERGRRPLNVNQRKQSRTINLTPADLAWLEDERKEYNKETGAEITTSEFARLCVRRQLKLNELIRDSEVSRHVLDQINSGLAEQEQV